MVISVREATMSDLETINKLATETFYETYSWYNTPENMAEYTRTNFSKEQTCKDLDEKESIFLLACAGEEVAGYAKMRRTKTPEGLEGKNHIEVERIYVSQKFQRQKVGYALIKKCMSEAKKRKLNTLWLGVWKQNKKAISFYERVGFKIFGSQVFRLGSDPQDDFLMKYDL